MPSGNAICYVKQALSLQNRTNFCKKLGGYALELQPIEDYPALVKFIWSKITNTTSSIAIGAAIEALPNNAGNVLLWQYSKQLVDYSQLGIVENGTEQQGQTLFLLPLNYAKVYASNFTLLGLLANDSASEFICMKSGTSYM